MKLFVSSQSIAYFFPQTSANEPREPVLAQVRHIGLPTKGKTQSPVIYAVMFDSFPGKYLVREEVEKAPTYDDQPCELTKTAVKISFPEEMRSEIFVNLLGYKEPNLLHLKRWEYNFGHQKKARTMNYVADWQNSIQSLAPFNPNVY